MGYELALNHYSYLQAILLIDEIPDIFCGYALKIWVWRTLLFDLSKKNHTNKPYIPPKITNLSAFMILFPNTQTYML